MLTLIPKPDTSNKYYILLKSTTLIETIKYLESIGYTHRNVSPPQSDDNIVLLLIGSNYIIKRISYSLENYVKKQNITKIEIVEPKYIYRDETGQEIKEGDILLYTKYPHNSYCNNINRVYSKDGELYAKMLYQLNDDNVYEVSVGEKDYSLYNYTIDDCGTQYDKCNNLYIIKVDPINLDLDFVNNFFPLNSPPVLDINLVIRIGDIVSVNFNNSQYTLTTSGEVLAIKSDTSPWIIKDRISSEIYYISEPCTISKQFLKKS